MNDIYKGKYDGVSYYALLEDPHSDTESIMFLIGLILRNTAEGKIEWGAREYIFGKVKATTIVTELFRIKLKSRNGGVKFKLITDTRPIDVIVADINGEVVVYYTAFMKHNQIKGG